MQKTLLAVVVFFLASGTSFAAPKAVEKEPACNDQAKIYKICSDQHVLFTNAQKEAIAGKKNLVLILGADWCPWCVSLHRIFDREEFAQRFPEMKFVEIGIYKDRDRLASGDKVLEELMAMAKISERPEGVPILALLNPKSKKAHFIPTEPLEKNTKVSKGHDTEKLAEALKQAAALLK